ncbi:MAG: hypothetical protein Q4B26_03225 [Eubacteriales bacterium]|nr:hypothetical protein [Eubacteriales bacterium]
MAKYQIDNVAYPIDFQMNNVVQRTLQNAKNLLMCRMGEVPYDRYRGFNPGLYDLPIDELNDILIQELDRVMLWEPDVEIVDAEASLLENGQVYIVATLQLPGDDDEIEPEEEDSEEYEEEEDM